MLTQEVRVRKLRGVILQRHGLNMAELARQEGWDKNLLTAALWRYWQIRTPREGSKIEAIISRLRELADTKRRSRAKTPPSGEAQEEGYEM